MAEQKQAPERIDARIPDHCGWAARGRWRQAYDAACDEITHMKAERDQLAAEVERLTKYSISEVAVSNPNVMDYMKHWEGRALKAEAIIANLAAQTGGE